MPVVVILPVFELGCQLRCVEVIDLEGRPELVQTGLLSPFDFAVQVGRAGLDRAPLDALSGKRVLELVAGELSAAIRLHTLDRKGHLVDNLFEEAHGILGRATRIETHHHQACAVIDGGGLNDALGHLAAVDLNALTWDSLLVALDAATAQ